MSDDSKERPRFVINVDWDDPHIYRTGPNSFFYVPDPPVVDAPEPEPLSNEWQDIGYTIE